MEKVGFVFEGGGIRGNFLNGVIDALLEEEIKADYIAGSSAGIGNGINFATGQKKRGLEILENYIADERYMGKKYLFDHENKSYFNIEFVFHEIPDKYVPLDFEKLKEFQGEAYACVTRLSTGKSEYIRLRNREQCYRAVLASCSLPLFFQPVMYDRRWYMDGGIAEPVPILGAIEKGCTKIVAVLTREREYVKEKDKYMEFAARMYRKYDAFAESLRTRCERYKEQREQLFQMEKEGKLFIIAPKDTEGFSRTESNVEKIRALYQQGYDVTKECMPQLKAYLLA